MCSPHECHIIFAQLSYALRPSILLHPIVTHIILVDIGVTPIIVMRLTHIRPILLLQLEWRESVRGHKLGIPMLPLLRAHRLHQVQHACDLGRILDQLALVSLRCLVPFVQVVRECLRWV